MGQQQRHRIGLIETGQIPEVTVLTKRPFTVGMVGDQRGSRDDCRGTTEQLEKALAPLGMAVLIDHGGDRATGNRQDGRQSVPA